jgi:hypothetical protein
MAYDATGVIPFGLRDVKLSPRNSDGTYGTSVDLPAARTMSFEESEDFEELTGDDKVVASRGKGPSVSWELEGGGISFAAYKVMAGGTITTTGTTPAIKMTYTKKVTDARPEFKAEGQAISDSGGDFHTVLYRCKASDSLKGSMEYGSFWLTGASGTAIAVPSTDLTNADKIYDFVGNETAVAIT